MTYELAKRLKDAGFPQEVQYGDWIFTSIGVKYYIGNSDDMDSTTGGYNLKTKQEGTSPINGRVRIPTLSELIEACGIKFISLSLNPSPKNVNEMWVACGARLSEEGYSFQRPGATPKVAVAHLWLSLNEK